jgi:antitoxin component of MazEF toxin-antitoxin module
MSLPVVRCLSLLACSLTLCLFAASSARADDLKDEAVRKQLELQKLEKEVKENLESAASFAKTDPEGALKLLKLVRDQISDDTNLSPERKKELLSTLDTRIKSVAARPIPVLPSERPDANRRDKDDERINNDLKTIGDLRRAGKRDEAERMTDDLFKRYPNNPGVVAAKTIGSRGNTIADARDLRDKYGERNLAVDRDIVKSATPAVDDMEFPKDWKEKSEKRSKPKLTDAEEKLLKALNTPLKDIDFEKMSLKDVLQYLQDKTGQSVIIPKSIMEEVGISYETAVTLKVDNVTLRTVLKKVLGDLNLTYIIKDATIQATTPERAKQTYSIRTYYIGDLAGLADVRLGPIVQRIQMAQTIALVMQTIIQNVEPSSWQANNAEAGGTITFDPITMSIIVKQTAEMHLILGGSMRR